MIEFVNPDAIASEINPDMPEKVAISAGRDVLNRLWELKEAHKDFALETTLSGTWHAKYLQSLKEDGFKVVIFFIWLRDEELAVQRVRDRRRLGGHDVPERDIRRRYLKSAYNMQHLYRYLADDWFLFDNTEVPPKLIALQEKGRFIIENKTLFHEIRKEVEKYGQETKKGY